MPWFWPWMYQDCRGSVLIHLDTPPLTFNTKGTAYGTPRMAQLSTPGVMCLQHCSRCMAEHASCHWPQAQIV